MEDHQNAARLAVTAAFSRAMPNYRSQPDVPAYDHDVTLYHAQPHGNCTPLGEPVVPTHFVDVTDLIARIGELLRAHASQADWLDQTQQLGSYVATMEQLGRTLGQMSNQFDMAEGWRRHLHLGFCAPEADPLAEALGHACKVVAR
jgi:hypothetical protein